MNRDSSPHPSDTTPVDVASILGALVGFVLYTVSLARSDNALMLAALALTGVATFVKVASSRAKARNEREDEEQGEAGSR